MPKKKFFFLPFLIPISFVTFSFAQAPEQDCLHAIRVCQSVYVQNNAYQGFGQNQELSAANNTCLQDNETNSSWYIFTAHNTGVLELQINPLLANDDYDFVVFDLTNKSCEDISNGSLAPVRCNYASAHGSTGLKSGYTGISESSAGLNQCAALNVSAGQTFALLVNNFTSTAGGYTLNFSGTASIFDNMPPQMVSANASACSPQSVSIFLDEDIQCTSIASDGSDFLLVGPGGEKIIGASSPACNANSCTPSVVLKFSGNISTIGNYKLVSQMGTDGNTLLDHCGNALPIGTSLSFYVAFMSPQAKISMVTKADCNLANGTALVAASGGTPPYTYSWNTKPAQTTNKITGLGPGIYNVIVNDANGCKANAIATIANKKAPVVKIVSTTHLTCSDDNVGAVSLVASNGKPPYSYAWNTTPVQNSSSISGLAKGTYMCLVTDSAGCSTSVTVKIKSPPPLGLTLTHNPSNCGKSNGSISAIVSGGVSPYTYQWDASPLATSADLLNVAAGIYHLTVSDQNNCQKTNEVFISNINGPDGYVVSSVNALCNQANGSVTVNANGEAPFDFAWNTNPTRIGPVAKDLEPASYAVTITDKNGCKQILSVKINNETGPTAVISSLSNASCGKSNGSASLLASGGKLPYHYFWNTNPAQNTPTATSLPAGQYQAYVVDSNGCKSSVLDFAIAQPGGHSDFKMGPACAGEYVHLYSSTGLNSTKWFWDFGDPLSLTSNTANTENAKHLYLEPGAYTVKLFLDGGCNADTVIKTIVVSPKPQGNISVSQDEITVSSKVFFSFLGDPVQSYAWHLGDGTTSDSNRPTHIYQAEGNQVIQLEVQNDAGCKSEISKDIEVLPAPEIFIPTAFTPDDDGLNDSFVIKGRGIQRLDMKIYDRWGKLIFFTNDVKEALGKGWDGRLSGSAVTGPSEFNYVIEGVFTNANHFYKVGKITLLP